MTKQFAAAALCLAAWTWNSAQAGGPTSTELIRTMQSAIEMKDFQNPMTLKEVTGLFYEKFAARGIELPILVNLKSFAATDANANDIYEGVVKFPPYPRTMTLAKALRLALDQLPVETTFLVRQGHIEIVAAQEATFAKLRTQKVFGHYSAQRVFEVIGDLCEQTGLSIVLDARIDPKFNTPVSVSFRNDISVQDALHTLTDMAGLSLVDVRTGFYVTTRDNKSADKFAK
jgi:hypothetical protein